MNTLERWEAERIRLYGSCDKKDKNRIGELVALECGRILEIEKPGSLITSFCFAEGIQCQTSYEEAQEMADHARTHEDYFREKNLEELDETIRNLEDSNQIAFSRLYTEKSEVLCNLHYCHRWEWAEREHGYHIRWDFSNDPLELSEKDRQNCIEALKKIRAKLDKRITAYLKRYGLSKIRSWTYWADR